MKFHFLSTKLKELNSAEIMTQLHIRMCLYDKMKKEYHTAPQYEQTCNYDHMNNIKTQVKFPNDI